ncbi:MAG: hypothetical protein ACK559_40375, partial [bacterium]
MLPRGDRPLEHLELRHLVEGAGRVGLRELALPVDVVGDGVHLVGPAELVLVPDRGPGARGRPLDHDLLQQLQRGLGPEDTLLQGVHVFLDGEQLAVVLPRVHRGGRGGGGLRGRRRGGITRLRQGHPGPKQARDADQHG